MKKTPRFVLVTVFAFLFFLPAVARGESIRLKGGKVLEGHIAAWSSEMTEVYFAPEDPREKPRWVPLSEIENMDSNAFPLQSKEQRVPPK
jgi:hypothetical protein